MMMMGNRHHSHHHSSHNDESGTKFVGFSGDQSTSSPGVCSSGVTGASGGRIGNFGAMFSSNNQDSSVASSVQRSSLPTSPAFDPSSFKSWGGVLMGGGGDMTRVFTPLQREELQRQTIIYKYMLASMPVPPELLISMNSRYPSQLSLPSYQSNDHGSSIVKGGLDLRYAIASKDAEPWRCKRTDGKKWRCSRDVAPEQKYCERHSHKKGRPSRSRKHVESSSTSSSPASTSSSISIARYNNNNNTLIPSPTSSAVNPANINIKSSFLYQPSSQSMFLSQHHQNSRLPEWFMKREVRHDHHQSTSIPTASSFFPQTELDQITPSRASHNSYMGNSQSHHSPTLPRQFLDAWSIGSKPEDIVEITGKPSDSSLLTLSMAGGSNGGGCVRHSEEAVAQLGMGLFDPEREREGGGGEGGERYSSWMGSSGPGGPLAEALCLGIVGPDDGGSRGSHGRGESDGGSHGMGFNM